MTDTYSETIKSVNGITTKRIEINKSKKEDLYNYSERYNEWYEIVEKDNKIESYGYKYYSNSNKKVFEEDWWEIKYNNSADTDSGFGVREIKVREFEDDGYGTKANTLFGFKEKDGRKLYDFNDKTIHIVETGEYITTKKGYDLTNYWDCFHKYNNNNNLVENYAKNSENEWYEKWYESEIEKYCFKWGKDNISEWEEEWKDIKDNGMTIEHLCYKKCKEDSGKEWYETWTERNNNSDNKIEKQCVKKRIDNGVLDEDSWGDIMVNKEDNEWLRYVHIIDSNKNIDENYLDYYKK